MSDTVQQIKEKLSILDVVEPYVKLTRAGRSWRGLSPFNKEKSPSFFVSPERGTYHCFSSSQGGDMFSFIQAMEGVDFKGALKILADKAGIQIVYEKGGGADHSKIDRLRDIMVRAETFFAKKLEEGSAPYEYALSRGLTKETIRTWNLGLAPDSWRELFDELTVQGFSTPELLSAGLIKEADGKQGTYYDRFRNRLMFPIKDAAGRTVAFTGRALAADEQAKYLNSPETELFKKHQVLFGMDRAKDAIRTRGFALLVEGQMDLLMLHQIGFTNTIALSGTALSTEHLTLIKRYADNLMLALDADRAGLAASLKSTHAAFAAGMRVKAIRMPDGKDPADLAKESAKDFTDRVANAQPIVEFFLSVILAGETDQHRRVIAVEETVLPLVRAVKSPMEQDHFLTIISRHLGSSPEALRAVLRKLGSTPAPYAAPGAKAAAKPEPTVPHGVLIRAIIAAYPKTLLAKRLENEYIRIIGTALPEDEIPERALFEADLLYGEEPHESAADDLLRSFERSILIERLDEQTRILRAAELAKDEEKIASALNACKDISAQLALLH